MAGTLTDVILSTTSPINLTHCRCKKYWFTEIKLYQMELDRTGHCASVCFCSADWESAAFCMFSFIGILTFPPLLAVGQPFPWLPCLSQLLFMIQQVRTLTYCIIFWKCIIFVCTLVCICICILHADPTRDLPDWDANRVNKEGTQR